MATQFDDMGGDDEVTEEARARAMGWKPLEEFRGDPRRWTDARTFIEHGEAELPILRDQSRRMAEKIARFETEVTTLRNTVSEQSEAVKHAMELARRSDERGYQRGLSELKAKQREAVQVGDTEAFDQIDEQIRAAETERQNAETKYVTTPVKVAEPVAPPVVAQVDRETSDFIAANPWFNTKPILKNAMIEQHKALVQAEGVKTGAELADQYERAKDEVVELFPQFFKIEAPVPPANEPSATPRPRLRAPALPSNGQAPRPRGASAFMRIGDAKERADAETAYASIKRAQPDLTPDEYIGIYFGELHPLDVAQKHRKG